jgi:hypothetical protein
MFSPNSSEPNPQMITPKAHPAQKSVLRLRCMLAASKTFWREKVCAKDVMMQEISRAANGGSTPATSILIGLVDIGHSTLELIKPQ